MTDYGHEIRVGIFLTPQNRTPEDVVGLAEHADAVGLDLVTFQDHPYQPAFLDTWTLLSWVAARTEQVHLAGNVLSLPLRPPAVLARAVASLDLLSGGRVETALGAGAFWDAIEAMGGRRLAPGEAVTALEEAIAIMRGVWDAQERSPLRVDGSVHRVQGAKRGPAPAHAMPIWVGAYKPRMLRLIGRVADGWLPSLGYVSVEDLPAANATIDAAAERAGRSPVDVRRLLNLPAAQAQVALLTELALEHGISTPIVATDDAQEIEHLATRVAPELRERVGEERARRAVSAPLVAPTHPPAGDVAATPARPDDVAAPSDPLTRLGVLPTPDDGRRRSARTVWREDDRPTAPEPPSDLTFSAQGRAVSQHLVDVHDMLRTELTQLRQVVEQVVEGRLDPGTARGAVNAMTLRQNDWVLGAYCANYCRVVTTHHTLEDRQILPHLRHQDPALEPVVERLEAEHVAIHGVLEEVDRALVAFVADDDGVAALQDAVDLLTDTLLSHLSYEERELTIPLARYGMAPGQV